MKKVAGKAFLNFDKLAILLLEIGQTLNTRPLTYLSDSNEDEQITPSNLLYGWNIARINFMYFVTEYCKWKNTLLNKYKRWKIILRFYDEYKIALSERHQHEVQRQIKVRY